MVDVGVQEEEEDIFPSDINVEDLFVSFPDDFNLFGEEVEACIENTVTDESPKPSPDSCTSWIREVEEMLMEDEKEVEERNLKCFEEIFSDILLEISDDQSQGIKSATDEESNAESNVSVVPQEKENTAPDASFEDKKNEDDDQITKKRKRQIRNRDAAIRSRERKRMYVKDLELKSRYLEGECIRLQRLLRCCTAENHALHLQLQRNKVAVASSTKQESAVLLLESLLLGSLLWLVGIMCLFRLPWLLCPAPEIAVVINMASRDQEIVDVTCLREGKNKKVGLGTLRLFFKCKQCKATRWRMKSVSLLRAALA